MGTDQGQCCDAAGVSTVAFLGHTEKRCPFTVPEADISLLHSDDAIFSCHWFTLNTNQKGIVTMDGNNDYYFYY